MTSTRVSVSDRPRTRCFRRQLAALVVVVGMFTAIACSPPPSSGNRTETIDKENLPGCPLDVLDKADGPVKVTVWYGGLSGLTLENLEEQAKAFNDSQTQVIVELQNQGKSYDETLKKFEPAPDSQRPGVVYLENTALRRLIDGGDIFPAEACMREAGFDLDEIVPAVRSYYTVDDVYWPGYVNLGSAVLYYNAVHFRDAGLDIDKPPATLAELREYAVKLKASGVDRPLALILNAWFIESWLNGLGIDVVDQDNGRDGPPTKATFATDEAADLLQFLKDLKDDGLMEPYSATDGQINQYLAVVQEKSSMVLETSTAATTIKAFQNGDLDPEDAGVGGDTAEVKPGSVVPLAGPFPGVEDPGKVRVGGAGFFITTAASEEEKAAGWKFLEYMLQPDQGVKWHLKGSYLPGLTSVAERPELQEFWDTEADGAMLQTATEQLKEVDPFQPGAVMGVYPEFGRAIKDALDEVMFKDADPAEALATAEARVDEALDRYNG